MIKGETVILIEKTKTGTNLLGEPIATSQEEEVKNVLIGNPSTEAAVEDLNLYGKHLAYVLGIPKGDSHNWKDAEVLIRGERFRTYGFPLTQTEENVPGPWNTQVKVEAYE
jgi:hypothetical protein